MRRFLSSIFKVVVLSCVWVPLTVRLPVMVALPVNVNSVPSKVRLASALPVAAPVEVNTLSSDSLVTLNPAGT